MDRLAMVLTVAKVPKKIVFVDAIPKGPTGKLQRIGLAERLGVESVGTEVAPASDADIVDQLRKLWRTALQLEDVGTDDRFLDSGGDSVTATRLAVMVENEFGIELPLMAFFQAATNNEQAALIEELIGKS